MRKESSRTHSRSELLRGSSSLHKPVPNRKGLWQCVRRGWLGLGPVGKQDFERCSWVHRFLIVWVIVGEIEFQDLHFSLNSGQIQKKSFSFKSMASSGESIVTLCG